MATPPPAPSGSSGSPGHSTARGRWGLTDLTLHAGFLPEPGDPDRTAMLDTLAQAGQLAAEKGVTLAFETGQETADLLRTTLDELKAPNLKVNFDPANMLLYDMGDPIQRRRDARPGHPLGPRQGRPSARRSPGQWGEEVPLGEGEVDIPRFIKAPEVDWLQGPAGRRARGRRPGRPTARRRPRAGVPARVPGRLR